MLSWSLEIYKGNSLKYHAHLMKREYVITEATKLHLLVKIATDICSVPTEHGLTGGGRFLV